MLDADNFGKQRLPSNPWKWTFTGLFGICGVYLAISSTPQFEIATLVVMAIVLGMAISDQLYKIVPDQHFILLAVSALGFISYNEKWWEPIAGAGVGLLLGLSVLGLGLLIHRRAAIGGADIKFYTCMGLVAGRRGIIVIFVLTTILFALQNAVRIATKKGSLKDTAALMPAAFVASTVYLIFLWNLTDMVQL